MWLRLSLHYDVGYLCEPLVSYRRHQGNETNAFAGLTGIDHEFRAKRAVASRFADRIDGCDDLVAALTRRCRDLALDEVTSRLSAGEPLDMQALTLAIETQSYMSRSTAEYADWLGQLFGMVAQRCHSGEDPLRVDSDASELGRLRQLYRSPRYRVANAVANAIQRTPVLWPLVRAVTDGVLRVENALRRSHRER
jgi:hypothetical protein